MDRQPMGRFPGICVLAAVVGGLAGGLAPAQGLALLPQRITFDQPQDAAVGQQVRLSAATNADAHENLVVSFRSDTPGLCTVAGNTVTPVMPGFCVITATQGGDAGYAPALDVARAFLAHSGPEPQTITFDQPPDAAVGQSVRLSAATDADPHENLAVSFRSDTPDACAVSGATVVPRAGGQCVIIAAQPGNTRYLPAESIQREFPVNLAAQTVAFTPPANATIGQPVTLTATVSSFLAVTYASRTPSVCTVAGATLTPIAAGSCTVVASQAGDDRYLPAPDTTESFPVNAGHQVQAITFLPPRQAKVGEAVSLTASATSGLLVAFQSGTPRICTVSGPTLTPVAAGTCTVTVSQGGSDHYAAARDIAQSFDVAPAPAGFPGVLTFLLAAVVFAAAGVVSVVRKVRRRSHHPPEPQPTISAEPVPGPPALVSVQNTGAGVRHIMRIESSPGASVTRIKEGRS